MGIRKTIYWFRLDEATGNISVIPINDYEEDSNTGVSNRYYRFKRNGSWRYIYKDKLDIVRNWSMFSFNDDEARAREAFEMFVADKWVQADKEAKRYSKLLREVLVWRSDE